MIHAYKRRKSPRTSVTSDLYFSFPSQNIFVYCQFVFCCLKPNQYIYLLFPLHKTLLPIQWLDRTIPMTQQLHIFVKYSIYFTQSIIKHHRLTSLTQQLLQTMPFPLPILSSTWTKLMLKDSTLQRNLTTDFWIPNQSCRCHQWPPVCC